MIWYIAAGIIFLSAIVLLVGNFLRDKKYMQQKTSESMNPELWEEIETENEALVERKKRFQAALKSETDKKNIWRFVFWLLISKIHGTNKDMQR